MARRDADASRHATILRDLRARIVSGALAPGDALPRRVDLEREFAASRMTIQRVFDELTADGFVRSNGRGGTAVAEHPPHRSRIALVLHDDPARSRFWLALHQEALRLSRPGREIATYANAHDAASPDARRLRADLDASRLAGMVVAHGDARAAAMMAAERVPSVAIICPRGIGRPLIDLDHGAFMRRAVERLVGLRRRRIATISGPGNDHGALAAALAAARIEQPPYWLHRLPPEHPEPARAIAQLLFSAPAATRPDALIIADDHLVEAATGGLVAAGMRVPRDVEVVAHCNFPWPTPSVVPAHRLGFDIGAVLAAALDALAPRAARRDAVIRIAPVFESERASPADAR